MLLLVLAVVYVCFEHFYPWLSQVLPFNELTVENGPTGTPTP
jgi:hypothetical protein